MRKRIERRQRDASSSHNEQPPLAPKCHSPAFQRPSTRNSSNHVRLTDEMVQDFIVLPTLPQAVGNTFRLCTEDSEFYYHVEGFETSSDGKPRFHIQFEGIRYVTGSGSRIVADTLSRSRDIVDSSGLGKMLKDSELVMSG